MLKFVCKLLYIILSICRNDRQHAKGMGIIMTQEHSPRKLTFGLLFFTALILAASLPIRIFQQLYLIEGNGFWRQKEATQILLYILLGVTVLVPVVLCFFKRREAALDLTRRRRIPEGIFALFASFAMMTDAVIAAQLLQTTMADMAGIGFKELMQSVLRSGAMATVGEVVFAVLSALFFIFLTMVDWFPKKKIYLNRLLSLAPLFWAASSMLRRFSRTINYLRVSDLALGLLALAALTLFFLYFAQAVSSISDEGRAARLFAAGIPAAVFGLLCFVPRLAGYLAGNALSQDATLDIWSLALPVFILAWIGGRLMTVPTTAVAAEAAAETEEPEISEENKAETEAEEIEDIKIED